MLQGTIKLMGHLWLNWELNSTIRSHESLNYFKNSIFELNE